MSRLSKYKQIDPEHLAALKAHKIKTVDDLWEQVGHRSDGVDELAAKVTLTGDQIITILAATSKPEPKSNGKQDRFYFWAGNYWREVLALLIVCVLFGLLVGNAAWPWDAVVVATADTLPAYHVICETDVKLEPRLRAHGSFAAVKDVVGRYLLKPAEPGTALSSEQLGPALTGGVGLSGRRVLSLPVRGGLISQTLAPADRVRLLFSPRHPAAGEERIVEDAVVLAVSRQGDASSVVVAVNDDDLAKAALMLGTSDVFISQSLP